MNRFNALADRLKEIILATRLANQAPTDKNKPSTPQEPEQ